METTNTGTPATIEHNGRTWNVVGKCEILEPKQCRISHEFAGHNTDVTVRPGVYDVVELAFPRSGDRSFYVRAIVDGVEIWAGTNYRRTELVGKEQWLSVVDYCGRGHVYWDGYEAATGSKAFRWDPKAL